jgi:hypothetical protein
MNGGHWLSGEEPKKISPNTTMTMARTRFNQC